MKRTLGFTLLELVVIIVILGILAGIAAPKLIDSKGMAASAALDDAKTKVESVSRMNVSGDALGSDGTTATEGMECQAFLEWAFHGTAPEGISSDATEITGDAGDTVSCPLTHDAGDSPVTAQVHVVK